MIKARQLETLLVIVLALVLLYWLKRRNGFLIAAMVVGLAGLLFPALAAAIHWGWTKLSEGMGAISGRVLLSVTYVLVLLPLSLISRATGKQTFRRKQDGKDIWKDRNHTYSKEDLQNPW